MFLFGFLTFCWLLYQSFSFSFSNFSAFGFKLYLACHFTEQEMLKWLTILQTAANLGPFYNRSFLVCWSFKTVLFRRLPFQALSFDHVIFFFSDVLRFPKNLSFAFFDRWSHVFWSGFWKFIWTLSVYCGSAGRFSGLCIFSALCEVERTYLLESKDPVNFLKLHLFCRAVLF